MVIFALCVIPNIPLSFPNDWKPVLLVFNVSSWLTLFMWICCWYCFCFSRNCWCCCWMTSWASVLWGKGADWVRFRGRWRGSLWVPLIPGEILSFVAKGDWGCKGTPPEKQNARARVCVWEREVSVFTYWYVNKDAPLREDKKHLPDNWRLTGWVLEDLSTKTWPNLCLCSRSLSQQCSLFYPRVPSQLQLQTRNT